MSHTQNNNTQRTNTHTILRLRSHPESTLTTLLTVGSGGLGETSILDAPPSNIARALATPCPAFKLVPPVKTGHQCTNSFLKECIPQSSSRWCSRWRSDLRPNGVGTVLHLCFPTRVAQHLTCLLAAALRQISAQISAHTPSAGSTSYNISPSVHLYSCSSC